MKLKWLLLFALLLLAAVPALSDEPNGVSRFHLFTTHCEVESNEGPETTPQSPPLEVDDPATPGCNRWEFNLIVGADLTRSQNTWELPLLDINYGIGDNIQLKYEVPYVSSANQEANASAIGESRVGIKYMFFEDEQSKLQLATYPQLTVVAASSDAVLKGLAVPGTIVTVPVLLAKRLGQTSRGEINLTANLGYNLSSKADTADFVSASVGVGAPLLNRLAFMGELTTEQSVSSLPEEARAQLVRADMGVMTTISRQFLLFASVGRSLYSSDTQDHTYALAGFRLMAGGSSSHADSATSQ